MKKVDLFKWTSVLSVVGIFLALYLFYEYLTPTQTLPLCYVNSTVNCDASTKGALANTLGIPTALWGLTGYIVILISSIKKWHRVLLGMTTFGLFFCLRITFLELFVIHSICPVCLACQLVMIAVFVMALILFREKGAAIAASA